MDEGLVREVQSLVTSTFTPLLMVATTPETEDLMQKSFQRKFIDVLKPFSALRRKVSIKNLNDQIYEVPDFQVRFLDMTELRAGGFANPKVVQQLAGVVSGCSTNEERRYGALPFRDRSEIPAFLRECTSFIPWFHHYRTTFLQSMGLSEHEFFDHPVACITVATVQNVTDTPAIYDQLYNPQQPPPLLQEEYIDQNLFVMRVLLDDGKEDRRLVDTRLSKMKTQYGPGNCFVLRMTSLNPAGSGNPNGPPPQPSNEDNNRVEEFVTELVSKGVIPHIDKSMRNLNEQVMATRRGFRNQVKYWFKPFGGGSSTAKPKSEGGSSSEGEIKTYPISSVGANCRQLADFAFMLRDFDSAQTNYKTCSRDFQNDKAMKYAAGTFEMIGLCSFMLESARKDAENELQKAYESYMRIGSNGIRYASRTSFFLGSIYKARRSNLDAANVYIRAADTTDDPLCAALFQEQAAFCFLHMNPPMHRRFAFRLIAAGDLFYKAYQPNHALGCFLTGYALYENRDWALIDDNLRFAIGRVSSSLGKVDRANQYLQQLLVSQSHNPVPQVATKQNSYFREFLHVFKIYAQEKTDALVESPIPLITNDSVRVFLNCGYESEPSSVNESPDAWKDMEDSLVNEEVYTRWGVEIAKKRKVVFLVDTKERISVVGEPIIAECEVQNPLNVPLQMSSLQLVCLHSPNPIDPVETNVVEYDEETVEVEPVNLLLGPGDSKRVRLTINPKREGYMKIKGLGFYLARGVWARRDFRLPGKRLNDTFEQRSGKVYAPNTTTSVRVCGHMPLMDISFSNFPDVILHGELYRVLLTIRNVGNLGLKGAKVKFSHPSFFTFGQPLDSTGKDPVGVAPVAAKEAVGEEQLKPKIVVSSHCPPSNISIAHLPFESLPPGASISIPLWVRGDSTGTHNFNFLFYYEPEGKEMPMKYRVLRFSKEMRVTPSIQVTTFTNPSLNGLDSYLLGLEIENQQSNTMFVVKQLTSISSCWKIDPLSYNVAQLNSPSTNAEGSVFQIGPHSRQSTNLFFRITPIPPPTGSSSSSTSASDSNVTTTITGGGDDGQGKKLVHASLAFSKGAHLDSTSLPHMPFLTREKVVRAQNEQAALLTATVSNAFARAPQRAEPKPPLPPNALDFILFWETADGKHRGQHNIIGIVLKPQDDFAPPETAAHDIPIRFLLKSPTRIIHDFDVNAFCVVPVVFSVKNTSLTAVISFTLEIIKPSDTKENNEALSQMRSQYFWSGGTTTTVNQFGPQEEVSLTLDVCFAKPGVFNLNRFRLIVTSIVEPPAPSNLNTLPSSASSPATSAAHSHPSASATTTTPKVLYCPYQHLITIEKASNGGAGA